MIAVVMARAQTKEDEPEGAFTLAPINPMLNMNETCVYTVLDRRAKCEYRSKTPTIQEDPRPIRTRLEQSKIAYVRKSITTGCNILEWF